MFLAIQICSHKISYNVVFDIHNVITLICSLLNQFTCLFTQMMFFRYLGVNFSKNAWISYAIR